MAVPVTSGVQFGFGHSKVSKNSCELVAVAVCAGTTSLPFLVEVMTDVVVLVSVSVNGSTRCPPGFVHVPVNLAVTTTFDCSHSTGNGKAAKGTCWRSCTPCEVRALWGVVEVDGGGRQHWYSREGRHHQRQNGN